VTKLDPRVHAFRADLAAAELRGRIDAPRYADARIATVVQGVAPLRNAPAEDAGLDTQLLYGERFDVYDEKDGWAWGQALYDRYVGYVPVSALRFEAIEATHRVTSLATPLLPGPNVKRAYRDLLPMNAKVKVASEENGFARLDGELYVYAKHLAILPERRSDWVAVAEEFSGAPYLWGGKNWTGCDCSGLIQTALEAGGIFSPRDTDMMETALGTPVDFDSGLSGLHRGDLVFWKGHIGVMLDEARLLHANAFHMRVAVERLSDAASRIAPREGAIRSIKRLQPA